MKETDSREDRFAKCEPLNDPHCHHFSVVADALGVDLSTGLTSDEAKHRLEVYGENALDQDKELNWRQMLLNQFSSIVVWLLAIATLVAFLTNGILEGIAIIIVLFLNALIGFLIEWRAGKALNALRLRTVVKARVKRDGQERLINAVELAIGDILILTAGDRIPADARLLEATNLRADESTFTGESTPVEKSIDAVGKTFPLAERHSMLFLGTSVVAGRAIAMVTATGRNTELGRIGQLIAKTGPVKTPLEQRLEHLGRILVYIVIGIAGVVMLAVFLRGDDPWLMLEVSISLAVAAVPEGLPAITTLILALGLLRLARRHAIVRRLSSVETLGSTTVICADKTGTLTQNKMTVREFRLSNGEKIGSGGAYQLRSNPLFLKLLQAAIFCNDAVLDQKDMEKAIGDPTETALLFSAREFGIDIAEERSKFAKLDELPFDTATKSMIVVLQNKRTRETFACMKGAPGVVLDACSHFFNANNNVALLSEDLRKKFIEINEQMAGDGLRVLGFAEKPGTEMNGGYTFLGFSGMSDPLRPGVKDAVRQAQDAGIRVIMLTGDQIMTARAIALELNLGRNDDVFALHSNELSGLNVEELANSARTAHVFARVSPEDKLRIVEALQKSGEIVAVTGDGINDAPALKRSDIGIAMGMRGTDVAKEAADVVLTDDDFSTIVHAIEGGRTIYANIIKFVHMMFSHNLGEVLIIFVAIFTGLPLPLLPLQILWVNLVTDVFPAFALAVEPPTTETMKRRPRSPSETLLSTKFLFLISWQGIMLASVTLGSYVWALQVYGEGAQARTVALLSLVGAQIGHMFNCRSRTRSAFEQPLSNPYIFIAAAIMIFLQALAVTFPPLMQVLGHAFPGEFDVLIFGFSMVFPVIVVETVKFMTPRRSVIYRKEPDLI